jgi:hypothetical protein
MLERPLHSLSVCNGRPPGGQADSGARRACGAALEAWRVTANDRATAGPPSPLRAASRSKPNTVGVNSCPIDGLVSHSPEMHTDRD